MSNIDKLTIEAIEILAKVAEETGQVVDWETASLVPRKYANIDPHTRDLLASKEATKQKYAELDNFKDSDPPEIE